MKKQVLGRYIFGKPLNGAIKSISAKYKWTRCIAPFHFIAYLSTLPFQPLTSYLFTPGA